MRIGSLAQQGYSLIAVAGSRFDPTFLPIAPKVPFRNNPEVVRAAIGAVRRARLISYVERGILPKSAIREPDRYMDPRDDHCVHLIIHRGNCFFGAIRSEFHRSLKEPCDPTPFFQEIIERNDRMCGESQAVYDHIGRLVTGSDFYMETSGWICNPDVSSHSIIALSLPASVWGLARHLPEFPGISTVRASNRAARTLQCLGGIPVRHGGQELVVHDAFYRGPVQVMAMHSRMHHSDIDRLVEECAMMLQLRGIHIDSTQ